MVLSILNAVYRYGRKGIVSVGLTVEWSVVFHAGLEMKGGPCGPLPRNPYSAYLTNSPSQGGPAQIRAMPASMS